ncbi:MAG: BolA/IbaG family iron-sulfur metabolism protein [Oligoflexales bacterium]
MDASQIESKLLENFPDAQVQARDLTGGGDHWQVDIATSQFTGKSLVEQHQMVYRALGEWMKEEIHALALNTKTIAPPETSES